MNVGSDGLLQSETDREMEKSLDWLAEMIVRAKKTDFASWGSGWMKREITIDYRTCDEETPALLLDPYPLREGETLVVRVLGHPLTQAPACFEGVLPECTTEIAALLSDTLAEGKCLTAVVKTRKELVSVPLHRSTASD